MTINIDTQNRVVRAIVANHFEVNSWAMSSSELATFFRYLPLGALSDIPVPSLRMDAIVSYRNRLM